MSHLEYDKEIKMRINNVHMWDKGLAKSLRCYAEATTECEPFKTDLEYLPAGIIRTDHGVHQEYCYKNMLVVADNITQVVACNGSTAQQERVQSSQKYLFATRTAKKEDEIYPITVKEVAEA